MNHHVELLENVPSPRQSHLQVHSLNDSPGNINWLFFVRETQRILGEVGAEYLNITSTNFGLLCGNIFPAAR
jgi:hypothetical protein